MKEEILNIASDLKEGSMTTDEAKRLLLVLFGVSETVYCSCDQPLGFEFNKYGDKFCVNCENLVR